MASINENILYFSEYILIMKKNFYSFDDIINYLLKYDDMFHLYYNKYKNIFNECNEIFDKIHFKYSDVLCECECECKCESKCECTNYLHPNINNLNKIIIKSSLDCKYCWMVRDLIIMIVFSNNKLNYKEIKYF